MNLKDYLLRLRLVRFLALARTSKSALSQLGWFEVDLKHLRISGHRPIPWMVYGAIDFIDQTISPELRVLELGGGSSTLFWLSRGNKVTTVESSLPWLEVIKRQTDDYPNHVLFHIDPITSRALSMHLKSKFDVIVNDFSGGDRASIARWLLEHIEEDGWIIWDNSEREECASAIAELHREGFGELKFFGLGPINPYAWQTSILSRKIARQEWETI